MKERIIGIKEMHRNDTRINRMDISWLIEQAEKAEKYKEVIKYKNENIKRYVETQARNDENIENMREMLKIQGYDGNWNYDEYMFGMYNGMELMLAIAENREPVYKEKPNQWLENKEDNEPVKEKEQQ